MSLTSPNLDDRTYHQLLDEAVRQLREQCPQWTDLSPSDPGMVLLEVFAHLTETMIYRLNRVPEKVYIEFLRLIGVKIQPPAAATVTLRFSRDRTDAHPLVIPQGTRVTLARTTREMEPPVFVTATPVTIAPGLTAGEALAYHCELVEGELAGYGTGLPGLSVQARRPPIVAPTGDDLDLLVATDIPSADKTPHAPALQWQDKAYRIWREVEHFTDLGPDRCVYVVDRMTGTITFAPAVQMLQADGQLQERAEALAAVPPAGREIRLWYRCGGGTAGNVAPNTLTVLKDPVAGCQVTNPAAATGGREAETMANALIRGPLELRLLQRVVTAQDYELVAIRSSGAVARAKAVTKASGWQHAAPGTVEVLLVPNVPVELIEAGRLSTAMLQMHQTEAARQRVQHVLDQLRPLGTTCLVNWVRYKTVRVKARVVIQREERPQAVKARILERLYESITPLPMRPNTSGWRFGQALYVSHMYEVGLAEPGVNRVEDVTLVVDEAPSESVRALAIDAFQPHTWYAGANATLFRSVNGGDSWEAIAAFPGEQVNGITPNTDKPGLLAIVTRPLDSDVPPSAHLHLSWDCGETWTHTLRFGFLVHGLAWVAATEPPELLLATSVGLYKIILQGTDLDPVQVLVDPQAPSLGFWAVSVGNIRGRRRIAVAARQNRGIYLSSAGAGAPTFNHVGLNGEDVRVLKIQYDGTRTFLWAGIYAVATEPGRGCYRLEMDETATFSGKWLSASWKGGSCRAIAFQGAKVLAATHHEGVLWLEDGTDTTWKSSVYEPGSTLPLRDRIFPFHPVDALETNTTGDRLLAAGPKGVFRSTDQGERYENCSEHAFTRKVDLPETWLFCSGEHDIEVVSEDEAT